MVFPALTLRDAVMAHPDYQAAALLSRAGMLPDAAVHARRLNAALRKDDAVALLAARASEAAGDYSSSATLMSSYFGPYLQRPATNLPDDFWALAYPRAYWTDVSVGGRAPQGGPAPHDWARPAGIALRSDGALARSEPWACFRSCRTRQPSSIRRSPVPPRWTD